jgi:hypothetical protein
MRKPFNMQYHNQKVRARIRNIEWQFTYDTWMEWWGEDIVNRGSKSGQLVMSRFNDSGPYHPNNVRKATVNENSIEARTLKPFKGHSEETRARISDTMKQVRAQQRLENTI